jgi:hypothetical protein
MATLSPELGKLSGAEVVKLLLDPAGGVDGLRTTM